MNPETVIKYDPFNKNNIKLTPDHLSEIFKKVGKNIFETTSPKSINLLNFQYSLTHKSYCLKKLNEDIILDDNKDKCVPLQEDNNEILEMLGDRVFDLIVVWYLKERYPDQNEGFLTNLKTKIVAGENMTNYTKFLGLERYILISKQVEYKEGRMNDKILEDGFEAFIGATFEQFGFEFCREIIVYLLESEINFAELIYHDRNYKDILVKYHQKKKMPAPIFEESISNGNNGVKIYTITIRDNTKSIIGKGVDKIKKKAEQVASHKALIHYGLIN